MLEFYEPSKLSVWFRDSIIPSDLGLTLMFFQWWSGIKKKDVSKAVYLLAVMLRMLHLYKLSRLTWFYFFIGLKQILQVKQDVQSAAGSLCLPLCGVCPVSANLGVTRLTTTPLVVWWSQVRYFHALGGILSAKFWNRMVLVLLEDWKPCICGVHEKELPAKLSICWFCSNV